MKEIKNGQCYKHKKLNVYKKITNAEKRNCIHIALENHKEISTGLFHRIYEDDFNLISEQEFEKAKKEVLNYFKDL